jgi:hypothetical protein
MRIFRIPISEILVFETEVEYSLFIPNKTIKKLEIKEGDYISIFLRKNMSEPRTRTRELNLKIHNSDLIEKIYPQVYLYTEKDPIENYYLDITSWEILNDSWRYFRNNEIENFNAINDIMTPFEANIILK